MNLLKYKEDIKALESIKNIAGKQIFDIKKRMIEEHCQHKLGDKAIVKPNKKAEGRELFLCRIDVYLQGTPSFHFYFSESYEENKFNKEVLTFSNCIIEWQTK